MKITRRVMLTTGAGGLAGAASVAATEEVRSAGPVAFATSRRLLANLPVRASAFLAEKGREGIFVFDRADRSAYVAADISQGIYVAPETDRTGASGAWVRQIGDGWMNPLWWGLEEGNTAADNDAAIAAMMSALAAKSYNVSGSYRALDPIRFPPGAFYFSQPFNIAEGTVIIEGATGGQAGGAATELWFTDCTGISVQNHNTSGHDTVEGGSDFRADATVIRNIALRGNFSGSEAEYHGVHAKARVALYDVLIRNFAGDGVHSNTSDHVGNTNSSTALNVRVSGCRNGLFLDGSNSNIWAVVGFDASLNRRWGICDSSFLGNSFFACHADTNGNRSGSYPPSVVSYHGNRYGVIHGQEVGASTNAPSGDTTDNTYWYYHMSGGPSTSVLNVPEWTSGIEVRSGGSFCVDNANARSIFDGCYHELGQGKAQLMTRSGIPAPSLAIGGMLYGQVRGGVSIGSALGILEVGSTIATNSSKQKTQLVPASNEFIRFYDGTAFPSRMVWGLNSNDLLHYYSSSANPIVRYTGPNTSQHFGTGAAVPYAMYPHKLMIGGSLEHAREITNGAAAPTAGLHGRGEIVFNRAASLGSPAGWVCSSPGTPGTWMTLPGQAASPSTTYEGPSGGAIVDTQCRESLARLAADLADLKRKLAASGGTA